MVPLSSSKQTASELHVHQSSSPMVLLERAGAGAGWSEGPPAEIQDVGRTPRPASIFSPGVSYSYSTATTTEWNPGQPRTRRGTSLTRCNVF